MLSNRTPDLTALEMLVAVHDSGSLSAAGKLLGLSQQAVSQRMRTLESLIGSTLVTRTPRGSTLTEEGVLVAGWAAEVLAAAERLDAGISSLRSTHTQQLSVAASQTVAEHLLPLWLVRLRKQQESHDSAPTTVNMTVTNSADAIALVRSGKASLGFIETPAVPADLASLEVQRDSLVVVTAPTHPWARRRSLLTPDELAATPLVSREEGSGTRYALEYLLHAAGHEEIAAPNVEFSTTAGVRSAVAAGTAPAVLSALAVRDDLALGRLVAIPMVGLDMSRPLTAIWQGTEIPPQGAARDLVAVAQRAGA